MRKFDLRLTIGGLLILGGLLALLQTMNIIGNAGGIFWGLIWGAVGIFFIYLLVNDRQRNWWAAFPGFILLGMAVTSFLPNALDFLGGLIFLGGISLAFWWVYFTDTSRWWAIIPAGVMLTLGAVSSLDEIQGFDTDGLFFIGLGLTFLLVAVLPVANKQTWAWIPAIVLLIFGTMLMPALGISGYVWPALLILLGGYLILRFFRKQPLE